jgi:ABC-2 type transport system ATP-binding protein
MISKFDFVKSVNKTTDSVKINVENGEEHITSVACEARDQGVDIEALTLHEPTLNDVFLFHTGREIREEGPGMSMGPFGAKSGRFR